MKTNVYFCKVIYKLAYKVSKRNDTTKRTTL